MSVGSLTFSAFNSARFMLEVQRSLEQAGEAAWDWSACRPVLPLWHWPYDKSVFSRVQQSHTFVWSGTCFFGVVCPCAHSMALAWYVAFAMV